MPTLDQVLAEWKNDSVIDGTKLNKELVQTSSLHAKYLDYYMYFKGKLALTENKAAKMRWQKEKYYRGEMSKEELDQLGWSQWQRLKPSSQDLNRMFESDRDLADLNEKIAGYKTAISVCEYIMKSIQGRDYVLKTIFEHNKYVNP